MIRGGAHADTLRDRGRALAGFIARIRVQAADRSLERERPLAQMTPTTRSLIVAGSLLVAGLLTILVATRSSLFALSTVQIDGATPSVERDVRRALRGELGRSLFRVDADRVQATLAALPTVAAVSVDRAFPHDLRVAVVPERGVALLRQGKDSWVVSSRGRVIRPVASAAVKRSHLPRVWIDLTTRIVPGETVAGELASAVRAAAPLTGSALRARVASVATKDGALTLRLRSGLEVRLGAPEDVDLKVAVAMRILPLLAEGTRYVDVSVPERPVGGMTVEPQVEVDSSSATDGSEQSSSSSEQAPSASDGT